ncbi:MAG: LPS export ABC transporter periplasmic protein LptC [Bacteroidota bacterium]
MISCDRFLFIPIALTVFIVSCKDRKDLVDQPLYDGPISSKDSINTLISDSAKVVMHMQAPRENSFENGDAEWPHGLNLESFGDEGESTTSFQANYVYYNKADNLYRSEGNVIVRNLATGDELNTEELFWNPSEEEFYTDKFVTIKSEDEVHSGEGLKANQDFTSYRILKPTGSFVLEESAQPNPVQ